MIAIKVDPKKSRTAVDYHVSTVVLDTENRLRLRSTNNSNISSYSMGGDSQVTNVAKKILHEMTGVEFITGAEFRKWYEERFTNRNLETMFEFKDTMSPIEIAIKEISARIIAETVAGNFDTVVELSVNLVKLEEISGKRAKQVEVHPKPAVTTITEPASVKPMVQHVDRYELLTFKQIRNPEQSMVFGRVVSVQRTGYRVAGVNADNTVKHRFIKFQYADRIIELKPVGGQVKVGDIVKHGKDYGVVYAIDQLSNVQAHWFKLSDYGFRRMRVKASVDINTVTKMG